MQAMATGLPVVSFGAGGVGEYLRHGVNGWLVDEPSPQVRDTIPENSKCIDCMR
jgi:glycosyltransferase involved in cell wall biosynthesis